jgi:hypothetical protein
VFELHGNGPIIATPPRRVNLFVENKEVGIDIQFQLGSEHLRKLDREGGRRGYEAGMMNDEL